MGAGRFAVLAANAGSYNEGLGRWQGQGAKITGESQTE
jgi:hypothetical protein